MRSFALDRVPLCNAWLGVSKPVIGMVHLRALPGAPGYRGDYGAVRDAAIRDAMALADGGVHGVILENFGDTPFFPGAVPAHTIAHMTELAAAVVQRVGPGVPVGVNVLRNDGCAALSIAHAVGAQFVRINILCGARVTDQGVIQGVAHDVMRLRRSLGADRVRVFADVDVKHSAPLGVRPVEDEVHDVIDRGGADAVIVSGAGTGKATDLDKLARVKAAAGDTPVFVGSGVTAETIADYAAHADGFIVGTSLKVDGVADHPVDTDRVRQLIASL